MHRICSVHSLLLGFAIVSAVAASLYPIFNPNLVSPLPAILLPPVTQQKNVLSGHPVLLSAVRRRHIPAEEGDEALPPEKEPSCEELKAMWRKMRRISRQMELTNEVPKLQDPFVGGAYSYRPSKYPDDNPYSLAKSSRQKVFQSQFEDIFHPKPGFKNRSFGKILRNPKDHHDFYYTVKDKMSGPKHANSKEGFNEFDDDFSRSSTREKVPGYFANNPLPEEALGVYGTVVNTPEERARYRALTRRPPVRESLRSRLAGLDRGSPLRDYQTPFRATKPHGNYHYGSVVTHLPSDRAGRYPLRTNQVGYDEFPPDIIQRTSSNPTRVERLDKNAASELLKKTCPRFLNKTCNTDVDCFCIGSPKLFCGGNKCRPQFKGTKHDRTPHWGNGLILDTYESNLKRDPPVWPDPPF